MSGSGSCDRRSVDAIRDPGTRLCHTSRSVRSSPGRFAGDVSMQAPGQPGNSSPAKPCRVSLSSVALHDSRRPKPLSPLRGSFFEVDLLPFGGSPVSRYFCSDLPVFRPSLSPGSGVSIFTEIGLRTGPVVRRTRSAGNIRLSRLISPPNDPLRGRRFWRLRDRIVREGRRALSATASRQRRPRPPCFG